MTDFKVEWKSTNDNPNPIAAIIKGKRNFNEAIKEVKKRHGNVDIISATPIEVKFPGKK